jgi:hypothetical protein
MKLGRASILGLTAILGLTPPGRAQVPAPPAPPTAVSPFAAGAPAAAVAPAAAAAPPQATLWGFLGLSKANCAACKDKICNSQLGVLLNNAAAPASALTGGLIPPFCPPVPSAAELAAIQNTPPEKRGPEQVADLIKADEAAAKARVAAVEYLGTVDCHYWPEATTQLINSLRADRNECVRFAAARVLSSGCCCNKETIEALKHSATGSDEDNNPEERSPRVRAAAEIALHNCLMTYTEPPTAPEPAPERPPIVPPEGEGVVPPESPATPEEMDLDEPPQEDGTPTGGGTARPAGDPGSGTPNGDGIRLSAYYRRVSRKPTAQVLSEARQALRMLAQNPPPALTTGRRSFYHAMTEARRPRAVPTSGVSRPPLAFSDPAGGRSYDPGVRSAGATRTESAAPASGNRSLFQLFNASRRRQQQ